MADGSSRLDAEGLREVISTKDLGSSKVERVQLQVGGPGTAADVQPPADGLAASAVLPAGAMQYNETTGLWENVRNAQTRTALASAARTATTLSAQQTNYNGRGILVCLDITAISGSGGLKLQLYQNFPGVGTMLHWNNDSARTTIDKFVYVFYPGVDTGFVAAAGASIKTVAHISTVLGRAFFLNIVASDASSYTYDVTYSIIP